MTDSSDSAHNKKTGRLAEGLVPPSKPVLPQQQINAGHVPPSAPVAKLGGLKPPTQPVAKKSSDNKNGK
jgi:hypothetical protein